MRQWGYVAACVVVPAVWGLLASWVYDRVQERRERRRAPGDEGVDMYHI